MNKLAALAETSMSEGKVDSTVSTEARSEEVRRRISRRHSVARALNIDNEMRREARERRLFERAFRPSDLILFWSSSPNFWIFPGLLAA
jgi:hypothetical protein